MIKILHRWRGSIVWDDQNESGKYCLLECTRSRLRHTESSRDQLNGEPAREKLKRTIPHVNSMSWGDDDNIVLALNNSGGLWRVPASDEEGFFEDRFRPFNIAIHGSK